MTGAPPASAALRPRSTVEVLDAAFVLARRDYWVFVQLAGLFHLPVHAFRFVAAVSGAGSRIAALSPEQNVGTIWWNLWNSLAVSAVTVAALRSYTHGSVTLGGALRAMRPRAWSILAATVAVEVLFEVGLLLLIVPGVFVLARLFAAVPVAAVESAGPWQALRRSAQLTRGNVGKVVLSLGVTVLAVFLADSTLVGLAGDLFGRPAVVVVFDFVLDSAIYPLIGVVAAVLYFDLRIRREGYDIELLLDASGTRSPPHGGGAIEPD